MSTRITECFVDALERQDLDGAIECIDRWVYFVSPAAGDDFSDHEGFRRWWELQISGGFAFHLLQVEPLDAHHVFVELLSGHPEDHGYSWATEILACVYTVGDGTAVGDGDGAIEAIEIFTDVQGARARARRTTEVFREDS